MFKSFDFGRDKTAVEEKCWNKTNQLFSSFLLI